LRAGVGEEVALLLGSALEHSEPLKWIDGWTWLDPSRRADVKLLDARTAGDIARARRARFYIDGTVIGSVDSSTVILRLNDARGDSLVDQVSSSGVAGSSVAQLGLTAVRQLLPRLLAPGRKVDIAPLSERSPAAIANWLQGEREYRQSQYVRALDYYRRALEEDSALSIAAVNGAQAADWMGYDDEARSFLAAALSHELDLPRKYAHLARGLQFFLSGSADSAVSRYRMALRLDPAWAAAWTALGDVYYHLLPTESPLDSLAEAAFTEARRADPDLLPPLYHLTEIALGRGELPRATTMLAAFRRSNPDPTWTLQLELMASCRTRGPAAMNWAAEVKAHAEEVFYAAKALSAAGAHWGCSESALRELLRSESLAANYRRASLLVLQSILVAERRYADVESLIDSAVAQGITDARGLYVLDAVAGAPFDRQAQAAMGDLPDGTRTLQAPRLWFEGSWQAHAGDSSRLATVVDQLDHRARSGGDPLDSLLAEAMAARLDLVRGDTARASTRLLALRPAAGRAYITWGLWQSLAAERMALAEILLAEGQPSRALEIASGFDHFEPVMFVLYWPRSLELRIRAATSLGRSDLAQRYAAQLGRIGRQDLLSNATRREPPQPRRPS
ncbi:MAG: tetratricopeptide repeat protein, partial [Gemmatimonadales bacterium]